MQAIIVRTNLQNQPAIFLPDTLDKTTGKLKVWNGVKGQKPEELSVEYYRSTKPTDEKTVAELSKKFAEEFKEKELVVRQRLYKDKKEENAGSVEKIVRADGSTIDMATFKKNFMAAIAKAMENV